MRWQVAMVAETLIEAPTAVTLKLDVPDWEPHRAGQHVDIRLTAEDGYSVQRSYSIASAPGAERLELTVVRLDDGEVSPYLTTVLDVGDPLELRGPIGGYFVWDPEDTGPVLLVGGGSGVVPLMAMLRLHREVDHPGAMHLVYSARTPEHLLYRAEMDRLAEGNRAVTITVTRAASPQWTGLRGRIDQQLLAEVAWSPDIEPRCFVCGPTPFVESAADALVALGHQPARISTERFG